MRDDLADLLRALAKPLDALFRTADLFARLDDALDRRSDDPDRLPRLGQRLYREMIHLAGALRHVDQRLRGRRQFTGGQRHFLLLACAGGDGPIGLPAQGIDRVGDVIGQAADVVQYARHLLGEQVQRIGDRTRHVFRDRHAHAEILGRGDRPDRLHDADHRGVQIFVVARGPIETHDPFIQQAIECIGQCRQFSATVPAHARLEVSIGNRLQRCMHPFDGRIDRAAKTPAMPQADQPQQERDRTCQDAECEVKRAVGRRGSGVHQRPPENRQQQDARQWQQGPQHDTRTPEVHERGFFHPFSAR